MLAVPTHSYISITITLDGKFGHVIMYVMFVHYRLNRIPQVLKSSCVVPAKVTYVEISPHRWPGEGEVIRVGSNLIWPCCYEKEKLGNRVRHTHAETHEGRLREITGRMPFHKPRNTRGHRKKPVLLLPRFLTSSLQNLEQQISVVQDTQF